MTLKYDKTKELLSKYTHEVVYLSDCPENKETLPHIVTYGKTEVPARRVNNNADLDQNSLNYSANKSLCSC